MRTLLAQGVRVAHRRQARSPAGTAAAMMASGYDVRSALCLCQRAVLIVMLNYDPIDDAPNDEPTNRSVVKSLPRESGRVGSNLDTVLIIQRHARVARRRLGDVDGRARGLIVVRVEGDWHGYTCPMRRSPALTISARARVSSKEARSRSEMAR